MESTILLRCPLVPRRMFENEVAASRDAEAAAADDEAEEG